MTTYDQILHALSMQVPGAAQIDRAQIDKHNHLAFSINNATWCTLEGGRCRTLYALDDPLIPLARWASEQAASNVIVLAYRPGKRLVLKDPRRNIILKGYRHGRSDGPAANHLRAMQATRDLDAVQVPALLDHDASLATLTLAFCDFASVNIGCAAGSEIQAVGQALAAFQGCEPLGQTLAPHNCTDELQVLHTWRTRLQGIGLAPSARWNDLFDEMHNCAPTNPNPVLAHRDLHDGQWLRQGRQLCLLDFDSLSQAHPMLDLGNFSAHIALRYLQWRKYDCGTVRDRIGSLLHGYSQHQALDTSALDWFHRATLLRLALVYAIRPRWKFLSGQLTELAGATNLTRLSQEY